MTKYLREASEKRIHGVGDHLPLVFEHRRIVDVFAHAVIKNSAVKYPGHLELGHARPDLRRQPRLMPAFPDDAGEDLVSHHADIPAVDVEPLQARIKVDAQPFTGEDHLGVGVVELLQAIADWP